MRARFILIASVSLIGLVVLVGWVLSSEPAPVVSPTGTVPTRFWQVQSIDTMKESRDSSRSPMSQTEIDQRVKNIADLGATHVAIGTPYDEEFVPRMKQWVAAARKYGLLVWFRGNWSQWEGWFGHSKDMTREHHLQATTEFINRHSDLFADGDIFTACPECENGSAGDPRQKGDTAEFRAFMIAEQEAVETAFKVANKKVITNFSSMNGDVARLVMDPATTQATGGVVSIDHYVKSPEKLVADAKSLATQSKGKIMLGEVGAPIPDLHGAMTEDQQAAWLEQLFIQLLDHPEVIGMNYWVDRGGSTALWNKDGSVRKAAAVIQAFYKPSAVIGQVTTRWGKPISTATVTYGNSVGSVDTRGNFAFPFVPNRDLETKQNQGQKVTGLTVVAPGFEPLVIPRENIQLAWKDKQPISIRLTRSQETVSNIIGDVISQGKGVILGLFDKF